MTTPTFYSPAPDPVQLQTGEQLVADAREARDSAQAAAEALTTAVTDIESKVATAISTSSAAQAAATSAQAAAVAAQQAALEAALSKGQKGDPGVAGPIGPPGQPGRAGDVGPVPFTKPSAWAPNTAYVAGPPASLVTYQGGSYVATNSHTSSSSFEESNFAPLTESSMTSPSQIDFQNTVNGSTYTTASIASAPVDDFSTAVKQDAKLTVSTMRDGALTGCLSLGAQTVKYALPDAVGKPETYGSLVIEQPTVQETLPEFLGSYHLISNKGASLVGTGKNDKVALFSAVTGRAGTSDVWSLNTVVTLDAGAGYVNAFGMELDCNNQAQHYGDAEGPAGALASRNYYGLFITGVGTYRKSAAIAVHDVVDGAWNRGIVFITGSISSTGSTFQDICNGHKVSVDILGAPTYGIRQSNFNTINWLNGSTVIGGNGLNPAARLHVEAGALGGGAGQSIEVFSAGMEAGPNASNRHQLRLTGFRTANGADANTSILRLANYVDGGVKGYIDFNAVGGITFNTAAGSAMVVNTDRTVTFSRPPVFSDLNAFPIYADNGAAAAAGYPIGKLYRTGDGTVKVRV